MLINLPAQAEEIINKLSENGFQAYAVGGCVSDSLLGAAPKDWDFATSAKPEEVRRVFRRRASIPTGLKHGTVTVIIDGLPFEITTFRLDGVYTDNRRPDSVSFTDDLREDLSRRDFTINAMAYNHSRGLVDLFGGEADLAGRLIRCVGCAEQRLSEDYLRVMRAFRFSAALDFDIEPETESACVRLAEKVTLISAERIRGEFNKIILSDNFGRVTRFFEVFADILFPEGVSTDKSEAAPPDLITRLAALFYKTDAVADILKRLKYDNKTLNAAREVVKHRDINANPGKPDIRRLIFEAGRENAKRALILFTSAETPMRLFDEISAGGDPCGFKDLAINGLDITGCFPGISGPETGAALNRAMNFALEDPALNERETLLKLIADNSAETASG